MAEIAVTFDIVFLSDTGQFNIMENDVLVASGKVTILSEEENSKRPFYFDRMEQFHSRSGLESISDHIHLDSEDIYKEKRLRGKPPSLLFRSLVNADTNCTLLC